MKDNTLPWYAERAYAACAGWAGTFDVRPDVGSSFTCFGREWIVAAIVPLPCCGRDLALILAQGVKLTQWSGIGCSHCLGSTTYTFSIDETPDEPPDEATD